MSLSESQIELLKDTAKQLRIAWKRDTETPDRYPWDTDYVFCRATEDLQGKSPRVISEFPPPRKPRCLYDLVAERSIKASYEDHNRGSYEQALKLASKGEGKNSWAAFQKILRAMERVYLASYFALELLPAPKVHFLHRRLLELAKVVRMEDPKYLRDKWLVDFLDDLCPCGKAHSKEAVRKLKERLPRR